MGRGDHERMELPHAHVRRPRADPAGNDAVDPRDPDRAFRKTLVDRLSRALDLRPCRWSDVAERLDEQLRTTLARFCVIGVEVFDLHQLVITLAYCLELTGTSHGVGLDYSRTGWERKSGEEIEAFKAHAFAR
jgi:hypothetical protein